MACDGPVAAVAWGATWLRFGVFPVSRLSHRVSHRKKASVNPALLSIDYCRLRTEILEIVNLVEKHHPGTLGSGRDWPYLNLRLIEIGLLGLCSFVVHVHVYTCTVQCHVHAIHVCAHCTVHGCNFQPWLCSSTLVLCILVVAGGNHGNADCQLITCMSMTVIVIFVPRNLQIALRNLQIALRILQIALRILQIALRILQIALRILRIPPMRNFPECTEHNALYNYKYLLPSGVNAVAHNVSSS